MQRRAKEPLLLAPPAIADAPTPAPRSHRRSLRIGAAAAGAVCAFALLTIFLEALSIHGTMQPNSDGATVILEGQSIANGHLALHGWSLSLDSFWGVDTLFYALAVAIAGVQASFLNLIPAVIASLVVLLGAVIAASGRRGWAAAAAAACVVGIIALPSHAFALDLLLGPLHIGTALWCLIAIYALRNGRFGWGFLVGVVFLAAGTLGDLQTIAYGTVPIFLAGVAGAGRTRRWRDGLTQTTAAVASVLLALAVREIAKLIGTFTLIKHNPYASWSQMGSNVALIGSYFPKLLGAGTAGFGSGGAPYFTQFAHGIALITVIAGVLVALSKLVSGLWRGEGGADGREAPWRLEDPLLFSFIGGLVVFVVLTTEQVPSFARYLAPSVIFGALLAGRLVGSLVERMIRHRDELPAAIPRAVGLVFVATIVVLAVGAASIVRQPSIESQYQKVGAFLAQRHLTSGVGDYWSASIVTVETNGLVRVRPVTELPDGKLVRYSRESTTDWYRGQRFYFVIFNPTLPFGFVNSVSAGQTWGAPERTWSIDGLEVLLYRHRPFRVGTKGIT